MGSKFIINWLLLFFLFLILNLSQQPISHNIPILVVQTHKSNEPKSDVYPIDKKEDFHHTLDQNALEACRWHRKSNEKGHSLVNYCKGETNDEANPDNFLEGC